MEIGVPTEVKARECRVGLDHGAVAELVQAGHVLRVQRGAGAGAGVRDEDYARAGARLVDSAAEAWSVDLVVKVKEPQPQEYDFFHADLSLFTYLHLAADEALTRALLRGGVRALAYESVRDTDGSLPLLRPMSEIAGRMSIQVGARFLQSEQGGKGLLLGGVPGTRRGRVTILGGGVVGTAAARVAVGMGARVSILDISPVRMAELQDIFGDRVDTLYASPTQVAESVREADLLVGAVLVPGARAPRLVDRAMLTEVENGSVAVDVAVDQGGCIATCKPTTHDAPTFTCEGVLHYCVPNMPGAVARTSTMALTQCTVPFVRLLANHGVSAALSRSAPLRASLQTWGGRCTDPEVASAHHIEHVAMSEFPEPYAA